MAIQMQKKPLFLSFSHLVNNTTDQIHHMLISQVLLKVIRFDFYSIIFGDFNNLKSAYF